MADDSQKIIEYVIIVFVNHDESVLLNMSPLGDTAEPITGKPEPDETLISAATRLTLIKTGLTLAKVDIWTTIDRTSSNIIYRSYFAKVRYNPHIHGEIQKSDTWKWIDPFSFGNIPLSVSFRKFTQTEQYRRGMFGK